MANTIQIRRGIQASLPTTNIAGEFRFSTDSERLFINNGSLNNIEVAMVDGTNSIWNIFDANTILAADTDNTPTARTISTQQLVGRLGASITGIAIGVADDNIVQVDGTPSVEGFAQFTANGLQGLTGAASMAALSTKATADFDIGTNKITSLSTPSNPNDAVNKSYVDNLIEGIPASFTARLRTTGNQTLSGLLTVDGVITVSGDKVLVDQQTITTEDGMYIVSSGTWTRATGWEVGVEVAGYYVFIQEGTTQADIGYLCTNDGGSDVIGTNDLVFTQFSTAGGGANKSLSNLITTSINQNLLPQSGKTLGTTSSPWGSAAIAGGSPIYFGASDAFSHTSTGNFSIGTANLASTGWFGKSSTDNIRFATSAHMAIEIGGTTDIFIGVQRSTTEIGIDEYLVTKGYVDEEITDAISVIDHFTGLSDTPASYAAGDAYSIVRVNSTYNALEFMAILDGGAF